MCILKFLCNYLLKIRAQNEIMCIFKYLVSVGISLETNKIYVYLYFVMPNMHGSVLESDDIYGHFIWHIVSGVYTVILALTIWSYFFRT